MKSPSWPGAKYYYSLLNWVIPPEVDRLSQQAGLYTNLVTLSLLALLLVPGFLAVYWYIGAGDLAGPLLIAAVFMVGAPAIFKSTGSLALARELFSVALFSFKVWETILFGGIISPGSCWFVAPPVIAILLGSVVSGAIWLVVAIGMLVGLQLTLGDNAGFIMTPVRHPYFLYTFSMAGMFMALSIFVLMVENARKTAFTKLEKANHLIHELAIRDALTGSYNRRYVWNEIAEEEKRSSAGQGYFCICLIDLDRFKSINDTFGHAAGDQVLKEVAQAIESRIREGDCFGRYGGEEFLLLLKDATIEDGWYFAERIRDCIESLTFDGLPAALNVTASIGLAEYRPGEAFSQTINRADKALYAAKHAGRNRISTTDGATA